MTMKEAAIEIIRELPENVTADELLAELDAKLDASESSQTEDAWVKEINRRVEEIRSGKAKLIAAEELFPELREPAP